jgi:hypothetical protein
MSVDCPDIEIASTEPTDTCPSAQWVRFFKSSLRLIGPRSFNVHSFKPCGSARRGTAEEWVCFFESGNYDRKPKPLAQASRIARRFSQAFSNGVRFFHRQFKNRDSHRSYPCLFAFIGGPIAFNLPVAQNWVRFFNSDLQPRTSLFSDCVRFVKVPRATDHSAEQWVRFFNFHHRPGALHSCAWVRFFNPPQTHPNQSFPTPYSKIGFVWSK